MIYLVQIFGNKTPRYFRFYLRVYLLHPVAQVTFTVVYKCSDRYVSDQAEVKDHPVKSKDFIVLSPHDGKRTQDPEKTKVYQNWPGRRRVHTTQNEENFRIRIQFSQCPT